MRSIANPKTPIYVIMTMEKSGAETLKYDNGKDSGFPDVGDIDYPGFYYSLEDAVNAMHENICDIRETTYDYGFVLTHYPGMYCNDAGSGSRIYFKWDSERCGFYEAEEPKLLSMLSF